MGRKGQLTVFIILGAIALISIGIVVFISGESTTEKIEGQLPVAEKINKEFEPIRQYVEDCLTTVSVEAFDRIGEQGGYLDFARIGQLELSPAEPTNSDAVFFTVDSNLVLPYWWYMSSENECESFCEFSSQAPALEVGGNSIETQAEERIDQRLRTCIDNFQELEQQGFTITSKSAPKADVFINEDDIIVRLDYELHAQNGQIDENLETFAVALDLDLSTIYELAMNITEMQQQHQMIEKHIRNVIDIYSGLDADKLPPVSDFSTELGPGETWVKHNVQQQVQELLTLYIPYLQVFGTRNYDPHSSGRVVDEELVRTYLNRGMVFPLGDTYPEHEVRFTYLDWWPIYFDLNCRGQLCQGESGFNTFGFVLGYQRYLFAYDMSVPVLVEVYQPEALNGRGYSFRFFVEANMRNNAPLTAAYEELIVPEIPRTGTALCDPAKRFSGDITVTAKNAVTGQLEDNIPIMYACGEEACAIGTTTNGTLTTKLPLCIGGVLFSQTITGNRAFTDLDIVDDEPKNVTIEVLEAQELKMNIKKLEFKKSAEEWNPSWGGNVDISSELEDGEQAVLMMVKKTKPAEEAFVVFGQVYDSPPRRALSDDNTDTVRVVPGDYTLTITLISEQDMTISPSVQLVSTVPFAEPERIVIPTEPISFNRTNPLIVGGAQVDVTITQAMLDNAEEIEFYTLAWEFVKESNFDNFHVSDLEEIGRINAYSEQYANDLQPRTQ